MATEELITMNNKEILRLQVAEGINDGLLDIRQGIECHQKEIN